MSTRIGLALGMALLCCAALVTPGVSATHKRHHARKPTPKVALTRAVAQPVFPSLSALWVSPVAGWDYTGYATADGVPMAILEDSVTGQGVVLHVGTQVFGGTVTEITRDHVRVVFGLHYQDVPKYNGHRSSEPPTAPAVPVQPSIVSAPPVQVVVQYDQPADLGLPLFPPLTADERQQARDAWRVVEDTVLAEALQPAPIQRPRTHGYVPPGATG